MNNLNAKTIDTLSHGAHNNPEAGMCLLEAASFIAGEPFSDHPICVDPVLGAFGRAVNDFMTNDERTLLIPIVPKLVGTACDHTISLRRAMLLCDGSIRQILPMAFDALDPAIAKTLRELQPITNEVTANAAAWSARAAWSAAESARSAAWSAAESARSAAESARSAAWSAAESARSAAWSAARSAARSAAESAAWSARSAAESAAWSAESAAWSAAESAAWSAESAARMQVCTALVAMFEAAIEIK